MWGSGRRECQDSLLMTLSLMLKHNHRASIIQRMDAGCLSFTAAVVTSASRAHWCSPALHCILTLWTSESRFFYMQNVITLGEKENKTKKPDSLLKLTTICQEKWKKSYQTYLLAFVLKAKKLLILLLPKRVILYNSATLETSSDSTPNNTNLGTLTDFQHTHTDAQKEKSHKI